MVMATPLKVVLPPDEPPSPDGAKPGGWWHQSSDGGKIICDLCPRGCHLGPEDRGFCFVRQNRGGRIVSTTYGRSTGFCVDPIEKKPLNQFYPGTAILSFGTAGCNLGCKFCQNWSTTRSREIELACAVAAPADVARTAKDLGCQSVAFTYNDPIVWAEYAIDTARACRRLGVKTVAVTSGYITPTAREAFYEFMDAANVDLKGFSDEFYRQLCGGRLEPVLDTLRWLVHQTGVWVELTNLVIPGANDSPDELRRMCEWIAAELRPDVPLHFSAFHPDFRLTDRGPTPASTLATAYEIARKAGLSYVYTGNISDRTHQSTYCPGCGRVVIERDGYNLGVYELDRDRCRHCGAQVGGRFGDAPGTWGARRMPVRITPSIKNSIATGGPPSRAVSARISGAARPGSERTDATRPGSERTDAARPGSEELRPASPSPSFEKEQPMTPDNTSPSAAVVVPDRPQFSPEQEKRVFAAAAQRVVAAVRSQMPQSLDEVLGDVAAIPVFGSFVSLKRAGQLRSCCGFLGTSVPLSRALDHAAVRAAKDDPRFPPISPVELAHLDVEVWVLWGMRPVAARGEARIGEVVIGRHGLQIARGNARGLLLPGVPVEHHWDAATFLQQVCLKAGLPPTAWKEPDSELSIFEGYAIEGRIDPSLLADSGQSPQGGPSPAETAMLADFCRRNLTALLYGATPSYYMPGAYDGGVHGIVLSLHIPGRPESINVARLSIRQDFPLQASLMELVRGAATSLQSAPLRADVLQGLSVGLTVLWDPAMQGTAAERQLEGIDPRHRALVAAEQSRWAVGFDPQSPPAQTLDTMIARARLSEPARTAIFSLAASSTEPRLVATNAPPAQDLTAARPAAVAGRFYPGTPAEIDRMIDSWLPGDCPDFRRENGTVPFGSERWAGVMVPHAGWVYSGRLAATALARVEFPSRVIVICPKHHAEGADWAVAPHRAWAIPGGEVPADPELARQLAGVVTGLSLDADAHEAEHAIEVQLPILARLAPQSRVVGIAIHGGDLARIQRAAEQLAALLGQLPERPLLVISTDMNHFADDQHTRQVDRVALDALETLDPARLFQAVTDNRITMCGVLPAVLVMETLRRLGSLTHYEPVGYATSADASGDQARVVGYAAGLFR